MTFGSAIASALAGLALTGSSPPVAVAAAPVALPFDMTLGPREIVFDWSRDHCVPLDIPDEPLRVFRRADGAMIGFASHSSSRLFLISKDSKFVRRCDPVMESLDDPSPADFRYETWIASTWTADGQNVVALADNEFQAEKVPGQCPYRTYYQCWFSAVVLAGSEDGGRTFHLLSGPPVAAAAFTHQAMPGKPRGFFGPSNIFPGSDGAYYAVAYTSGGGDQVAGTCLFRTLQPGRAEAWEYWTGQGFVPSAYNPYRDTGGRKPCEPLKGLPGRVSSIVRYQGLYVAVFAAQGADQNVGKIGISVSTDLFNWSPYQVVMQAQLIWSKVCNQPRYAYPSIIDLASSDRNFATIGDTAYLYLTEAKVQGCALTIERNLVRYPLIFRQNSGVASPG